MPRKTQLIIGIGSNIDPERYVVDGVRMLGQAFEELRLSTFYRTRPLHERDQPPYVNGVAVAYSKRSVEDVLRILDTIEQACGRRRDPCDSYASRTLDLDLMAYGDMVNPHLDLPSRDLLERDFCLIPAAELVPGWIHPVAHEPLKTLAVAMCDSPPNLLAPVHMPVEGRE